MEKTTKKDLENKAILKPCKTLKNKSDTNISDKTKKGGKGLEKGQKPLITISEAFSLTKSYSALLILLKDYRVNNRADVYIFLALVSSSEPLSLSTITRLSGLTDRRYTFPGINRLIELGLVERLLLPRPVYCLSVSCKDQLLQLIDEI